MDATPPLPAPPPPSAEHVQTTFARAVHVVFGEWTALRLAIENEWAGGGTRDRGLALLKRVLDGLLSTPVVYRDEIEGVLDLALVDDFNIEQEDDSPAEVAALLHTMHTEARAGVTTTADAVLRRNAGKKSWVEVPPPPKQRDDSSSSDECDDDDADGGGGGSSRGPTAMDEDDADGGGGSSRRPPPEVDEDGFEMVQTRSRGRGRK